MSIVVIYARILLLPFSLIYASPTITFPPSGQLQLALFASSGCYSHDIMMQEVGAAFESMEEDTNKSISSGAKNDKNRRHRLPQIHWVQIFMHDFGFGGQLPRPSHWRSVVEDRAREEDEYSKAIMAYGQQLLWKMNIPFDHERPWDLRGALFFFHVLRSNNHHCQRFVRSRQFRHFLATTKIDLVIVDHFIQECFEMAASLLNASITIQFSNWPIADGYIASFNVPAPPSAYPMTGTTHSPKSMSRFPTRLWNTLWHLVIMGGRAIQGHVVNTFYTSIGHPQLDLDQTEAKHLFYAGRAEFLAEPVRPINNRIKHFGCPKCKGSQEYDVILMPPSDKAEEPVWQMGGVPNMPLPPLGPQNESTNCLSKHRMARNGTASGCQRQMASPKMPSSTSASVGNSSPVADHRPILMAERYRRVQLEWPQIGWAELERRQFVLITFGSVAKMEFMPAELYAIMLDAFSRSSHLIIWQTNSAVEELFSPDNGTTMETAYPHPNLRFSILHGGVNTINEALMFGKPILGLPLQGDQPSNLQRLVELGMAELLDIRAVWAGELANKMAQIEANYGQYLGRARKVGAMVGDFRRWGGGQQAFWLRWTAQKGRFLVEEGKAARFFHLFYRSFAEHFALPEIGTATLVFTLLCTILSK